MCATNAKKATATILSFFIAFGLITPAYWSQWLLQGVFPLPIEMGVFGAIEEILKGALSLILIRLIPLPMIAVAVGAGYGIVEGLWFIINGALWEHRVGAAAFHFGTGIILWLAIKRRSWLWITTALIINILLHWQWNLIALSYLRAL